MGQKGRRFIEDGPGGGGGGPIESEGVGAWLERRFWIQGGISASPEEGGIE